MNVYYSEVLSAISYIKYLQLVCHSRGNWSTTVRLAGQKCIWEPKICLFYGVYENSVLRI